MRLWRRRRRHHPDYDKITKLEAELGLTQQRLLLNDGTMVQVARWPELATTTITTASYGTIAVDLVEPEPVRMTKVRAEPEPEPQVYERNPVLDAGYAWLFGGQGLRPPQSNG